MGQGRPLLPQDTDSEQNQDDLGLDKDMLGNQDHPSLGSVRLGQGPSCWLYTQCSQTGDHAK